ncbi:gamma-glutamyltransferase family protein [Sphingomonas sp.]|jgi:gamma-glutamyltranspeptidase/glutathione hydrolase|uniref:gamma-glutamyltransferase family protein n=1 Tax=Sphingomonas sp. TaxID=28214 RepID=UPI0026150B5A|nr:gamma-glutamyltransferase family protein [Sphingomonas sp.]MDF2495091.1 gamma-glutamyltransferase [Sphingomonas sp.]
MKNLLALTALLAPVSALAPLPALAQGMVTSADPRATEAGREILRAGGSAADAALAMMLALTVVEPQSSGIGGGGFLLHQPAKGPLETIDGREKAPMAATPDRFLGADGKPIPFVQAFPGGKSVGVPGNIRLAALASKKWGKLPWKALFTPAIRLAENGYTVTRPMASASTNLTPMWGGGSTAVAGPEGGTSTGVADAAGRFPQIAAMYSRNGKPLAQGETIKNPTLAKLLRKIAAEGPDAFYTGDNAKALLTAVTTSKVAPGDMTAADLTAYQAKERAPVCGTYRTYKVCGMGPPSSGATTVLQILGMLERFDLAKLGKDSPESWHLIAEAMQLAYADRDKYLGDADFVDVPVAGLIDKGYIAQRSALISPTRALGRYEPGTPPGAQPRTAGDQPNEHGTTHFIAVDRKGDVATMTSTIEMPFGSQLMANGFVLNNELTDFSLAPEKNGAPVANRVEPGKRPLSSMSPTIVYDASGTPVFTVGAAGGKTIIMQVAKAIIAHFDWKLPARDALGLGLVFFNNDGIVLEQGTILAPMKPALEAMGHKVSVARLGLKANAAEKTATGWVGAADPRGVGNALSE